MDSSSKTSLESSKTTTQATFPITFPIDLQGDLFSDLFPTSSMIIRDQIMEDVQNVRPDSQSILFPVIRQQAATNEMEAYDDFMTKLCNDIDNDILQMGEDNFKDLLSDEPIPLDGDISLDVLKAMEAGLGQELANTDTTGNSLNQFQSPVIPVHPYYGGASASSGAGVDANAFVAASAGGINASFGVGVNASGGNTSVRLATNPQNPLPVGATFGNFMFPNTTGNTLTHFQSCSSPPSFPVLPHASSSSSSHQQFPRFQSCSSPPSFPVLPHASSSSSSHQQFPRFQSCSSPPSFPVLPHASSSSSSHQQFPRFQSCSSPSFPVLPHASSSSSSHQQFPRYLPQQMTGINPQGILASMPQYNQGHFWLRPPSLTDFPNFVHAWEGSLVGKIHSYCEFLNQARLRFFPSFFLVKQVVRKPTSPVMLTAEWSERLKIVLFIPTNAINYTMKIIGGPIDYVFFHIIQFNNLNLYDYMMSKNLCAKIELPSQTLILSITQSKYHYLGAIFPEDTIFVEPA
uniref:Mediator of RNA polymerase II transcription subunit 25 n=1 Tax=Glycine max TaxID=3847 RepID=A0A0R0KX57_SOYBN